MTTDATSATGADERAGSEAALKPGPGDGVGDGMARSRAALASRLPLRALVFIAGVVSLAIEMCGPRLMAPYFGTSQIIWATQIGFTLLYLSLGYFIGGRLADRYPQASVVCGITTVAAVATGLIPLISRSVLDWSVGGMTNANPSVFISALIAVNLLFAVPTILLGMVSPFAIRLTVEQVGSAGRSAGSLYALSTLGSIIGAFLPALVLIPAWGVRNTLYAACIVLLVASVWGLRLRGRAVSVALGALLLVPMLAQGPLKSRPGLIYEQESLYNYIQVVREADGTHNLILNEGAGAIHSKYHPDRVLFGSSWYAEYLLMAPYFNEGFTPEKLRRIAIVGLAGGTLARQYTAAYGPIAIDGVEIDPAIVDVGRRYFGMDETNLNVHLGDGRTFMRTTQQTYDVVMVDAFQQPYMPFHLTTREFLEEIKARLSPTGVVTFTTGHTCTDYRLAQAFVNTLSQVFPSVYMFDVPGTLNTEIIATMQPTTLSTFRENLLNIPTDTMLGTVEALQVMEVATPERDGIVFSDDRAPVEQLTDQLILSYIRCQ
jgi:spermidine synthase